MFQGEPGRESKRPKLQIDKNSASNSKQDEWGDENEDEVLLLASQACEQAFSKNESHVLEYDIWKKPITNFKNSTQKDDNIIEANTFIPNESRNHSDFLNIIKQLQSENTKYKQDNVRLQEQFLTKEGEAAILRSQLKMKEAAVEKARMEKCKIEQLLKMESIDKLSEVQKDLNNFKTQLEFKELEVVKLKQRCKALENSKIKLSQPAPGTSRDKSTNFGFCETSVKPSTSKDTSIKKEDSSLNDPNIPFKLITVRSEDDFREDKKEILELVNHLQNKSNKVWVPDVKVVSHTEFAQCQYGMHNLYHQVGKENSVEKCDLYEFVEDFISLSRLNNIWQGPNEHLTNIFKKIKRWLDVIVSTYKYAEEDVQLDILQLKTSTFLMPEPLYSIEEALSVRQILAVILLVCNINKAVVQYFVDPLCDGKSCLDTTCEIGKLCLETNCSPCYIAIVVCLLRIVKEMLVQKIYDLNRDKCLAFIVNVLKSNPPKIINFEILELLTEASLHFDIFKTICNFKTEDSDRQNSKASERCILKQYLKEMFTYSKTYELRESSELYIDTSEKILMIYSNTYNNNLLRLCLNEESKCRCQFKLIKMVIYSLCTIAEMVFYHNLFDINSLLYKRCISICVKGARTLISWTQLGIEFYIRIYKHDDFIIRFIHLTNKNKEALRLTQSFADNLLLELISNYISNNDVATESIEDTPHNDLVSKCLSEIQLEN